MNKNMIITALQVLLGNAMIAFVVNAFVVPMGLVMGGSTGFGLVVNYYVPALELPFLILCSNIVLFISGAIILGKKFALTTILSTLFYPLMLKLIAQIPNIGNLTENELLAAIYTGIILGLGIGIIVRAGASTGGSDILALILNKGVHLPIAICMYIVDFIIIGVQIPISTAEELLFGILALLLCAVVIDKVTLAGQSQIQVFIISAHYQEIRRTLLEDMSVGATLVRIETGLEGKEQSAILCVFQNRKLYNVKQTVLGIDPKAFITISQINEVKGRGFSLDRKYK